MHTNKNPLDVARAIALVNNNLNDLGWVPRDADGSDFACPDYDVALRFKTGGSYGEVTTLVMVDNKQVEALRATSWAGIDRMLLAIRGWIDRPYRETLTITDGAGNTIKEVEA